MTYPQTIDLLKRRILFVDGKLIEYRSARTRFPDVPPAAINVARIIVPIAMVLTAVQRSRADSLLPYVRELNSAAARLNQIMGPSIEAAANPPFMTSNTLVAELRAQITRGAITLQKAQTALNEWADSPAFYHSGRVPAFQAYIAADPAGPIGAMVERIAWAQEVVTGTKPTPRAFEIGVPATGSAATPAQRTASQEAIRLQTLAAIEARKQPSPLMGAALGASILVTLYWWKNRKRA